MRALFERHELLNSNLSGKTNTFGDKEPTSGCAHCIELSTFALEDSIRSLVPSLRGDRCLSSVTFRDTMGRS